MWLPRDWESWTDEGLRKLAEAALCELQAKVDDDTFVHPAIADFVDDRFG